jgi:hypothetical protein
LALDVDCILDLLKELLFSGVINLSETLNAVCVLGVLVNLGAMLLAETIIVNKFTICIALFACKSGDFIFLRRGNTCKGRRLHPVIVLLF